MLKSIERESHLLTLPRFPLTDDSLTAPADLFNSEHNFTASRHLWEADSSLNFFRAWNEKPQYIINDMGFKDFWSYGRPEDVDDFTKLMLTA